MIDSCDAVVGEQSIDELLEQAIAGGDLFQPGTIYSASQISNALYHRGPGISSTNLKHANVSALHYITHRQHPKPSTQAMMLGTWLHTLVLEPDVFYRTHCLPPEGAPRRPTSVQLNAKKPSPETIAAIEFWQAWDAENGDKTIIENKPGGDEFWSPGDWDRLHYMRDALKSHPFAGLFLENFEPECSIYWHENIPIMMPDGSQREVRELCKCRYDLRDLNHPVACDIKTAADASYSGFSRAVFDFGYHISREHYMRGAEAAGLDLQDFVFLVVEKEPPWAVGVYTIDQESQHLGTMLRKRALEAIATAHETKEYPCYPAHVRELATPGYAKRVPIS